MIVVIARLWIRLPLLGSILLLILIWELFFHHLLSLFFFPNDFNKQETLLHCLNRLFHSLEVINVGKSKFKLFSFGLACPLAGFNYQIIRKLLLHLHNISNNFSSEFISGMNVCVIFLFRWYFLVWTNATILSNFKLFLLLFSC